MALFPLSGVLRGFLVDEIAKGQKSASIVIAAKSGLFPIPSELHRQNDKNVIVAAKLIQNCIVNAFSTVPGGRKI